MRILVLSVHPDDETLGAGGTILKHREQGDRLSWTIVTSASAPRWPEAVLGQKTLEIERVAAAYGMTEVTRLGFDAARLDTVPQLELIDALRTAIDQARPEVVYLVHGGDVHTDHRATFVAAMSVLKPFHMAKHGVRRVLSFETLSSTDAAPVPFNPVFVPTVFSDITPFLRRKLEVMAIFDSEAQQPLMPRGLSAIEGLARFRGATIGVEFAEAFMPVREIL